MNNNKLFYYIVGVGVILILAAGTGGYFYGSKLGYVAGQKSSEAEINNLKSTLATYFLPPPEEVFSLSGTVKEVGNNFIKIEIASFSQYPPPPGASAPTEMRTVRVGAETAIAEFTFDRNEPPVPTGEGVLPQEVPGKKIKLSDLKVGDQVTVEAAENIKNKMEFTATKIQKIPTATFPAPVIEVQTPSL